MIRLYRNASWLLGGRAAASILALFSTAITARALGPESFGHLALITAYVTVIDRLVNFQSWQAVIKYGADTIEQGDDLAFRGLIKLGALLDGATALGGTLIAVALVPLAGSWLGWNQEILTFGAVYSLVILAHISGTPTAILRLFNRFDLLAFIQIAAAVIQLAGVLLVLASGGAFLALLVVWGVTDIAGKLLLVVFSWTELRRQRISPIRTASIRSVTTRFPGLWSFVWTTNLNGSIRMASREFDILIVGGTLGAGATGIYKIAKQLASVLSRLTEPLYQAVFPEVARLTALGRYDVLKQFVVRSAVSAGVPMSLIWLIFVAFGAAIIQTVVGVEYVQAYPVLVWYMLALVVSVFAFPLQPTILAMGLPHVSFWIQLTSTAIYLPALVFLMKSTGLVGAALAYVLYYTIWAAMMLLVTSRIFALRRTDNDASSTVHLTVQSMPPFPDPSASENAP